MDHLRGDGGDGKSSNRVSNISTCQDSMWELQRIERGVLGCLDGVGCQIEPHLGVVPYVVHRSSEDIRYVC